jgi:hypothetical protein
VLELYPQFSLPLFAAARERWRPKESAPRGATVGENPVDPVVSYVVTCEI